MKISRLIILLLCGLFLCTIAGAEEKPISQAIKDVVAKNMAAYQNEDINAVLETVHTQSPAFIPTKQGTQTIFDNYGLKYKLVYFKFIGQDGDYAVARTKQLTEKVSGPAFNNNEVDMVQVFKQENGIWKFWGQAILDVSYK